MYDSVSQMEPMFPSKGAEQLADSAVDLVRNSSALGGHFRSHTREALVTPAESNLIEGHNAHRSI